MLLILTTDIRTTLYNPGQPKLWLEYITEFESVHARGEQIMGPLQIAFLLMKCSSTLLHLPWL